jgi:nickel superoxide dismutase
MVMRINALSYPNSGSSEETATYNNSLSRYIAVKEQHADLVKQEIDILWHDYFKPEHLEKYPTLHTIIWEAAKLSSTNKQSVDLKSATELVAAVDNIAEIFWATKGINYNDTVADTRFGT